MFAQLTYTKARVFIIRIRFSCAFPPCCMCVEFQLRMKHESTYFKTHEYSLTYLLHVSTIIYAFLAHLSHWLIMSYCDCWMSVVRRQQLLQRTSPPKLLVGFKLNLVGMILIWSTLKIVQMVLLHCIARPHRGKRDFQDENFKKSFSLKPQGLEL